MKKRIISIALVVAMIVVMIPAMLLPTAAIGCYDGYEGARVSGDAINVDANADESDGLVSLREACIVANGDAQAVVDSVVAQMKVAHDYVIELASTSEEELDIPGEYSYTIKVSEKTETEEVELEINVHESDDNMIVYEEFENGMALILNFNNYRVMVNYNGVTYTVDAYDYIILNKGN